MKDTKFSLNRHEECAREQALKDKASTAHALQYHPERDRMQSSSLGASQGGVVVTARRQVPRRPGAE